MMILIRWMKLNGEETNEAQYDSTQTSEPQVNEDKTGEGDYLLTHDRTRRDIKTRERYGYPDLIALSLVAASEVLEDEPNSFKDALAKKEKENWTIAISAEMKSLHDNHSWALIKKPVEVKIFSCKWIFKIKERIPGVVKGRFKAKLVARVFTQRECIEFNYVFCKTHSF